MARHELPYSTSRSRRSTGNQFVTRPSVTPTKKCVLRTIHIKLVRSMQVYVYIKLVRSMQVYVYKIFVHTNHVGSQYFQSKAGQLRYAHFHFMASFHQSKVSTMDNFVDLTASPTPAFVSPVTIDLCSPSSASDGSNLSDLFNPMVPLAFLLLQ